MTVVEYLNAVSECACMDCCPCCDERKHLVGMLRRAVVSLEMVKLCTSMTDWRSAHASAEGALADLDALARASIDGQ